MKFTIEVRQYLMRNLLKYTFRLLIILFMVTNPFIIDYLIVYDELML